ncbi:MAG: iron transporter [Actinomycetota bacterium]
MAATDTRTPPRKISDEANAEELQLANKQGRSYAVALEHMVQQVAHDGKEQAAGDYLVAYAVEEAEGMYLQGNGGLEWHDPGPGENCHVEIAVRDKADGRFIPGLDIHIKLLSADGKEVASGQQPFIWHPWLMHYGRNWKVPGDGDYKLQVRIEAPTFHRHDKENGKRYARAEEIEFEKVNIATGQK